MRIASIEWYGYCVPFTKEFVAAGGRAEVRHGLLLRIKSGTGLEGWGEASPVGPGKQADVENLAGKLRSFAPLVLGASIADEPSVRSAATKLARAPAPLRFGVETAMYDLLGKARGLPIASLLGGTPRPVEVNAIIAAATLDNAVKEARESVAAGFNTIKLKVGALSLEADVRLVAAVRKAVGPKVAIRVDANQGWSVLRAIETIRRLEQFHLEYVEQPVPADNPEELAAVRRAVATPIAADESLSSLSDARRLLKADAVDIFIVKAARAGLLGAKRILDLARKSLKPAIITSSLEVGIGVAASLHLAAARGSSGHACGLATGSLLESDLLLERLRIVQGVMYCPQEPGLGVAPDEEALRRYSTDVRGVISIGSPGGLGAPH